jgi:putative SOS response-associated peptidase YedK
MSAGACAYSQIIPVEISDVIKPSGGCNQVATPTETIGKHFNAYPNHDRYKLPVITEEETDKILMFYWGLVPVWWTRDERGGIVSHCNSMS